MTLPTLPRSSTRSGTAYHARGSGEAVILVHGVGLRLEAWAAQLAALSATHRVIAADMPGHGGSAPLAPGSGLPDFVGWLARLLDDLGIERANIAGHSMGALIVGGMAATQPERLSRVALLNGVHRRTPEARAAAVARAAALDQGSRDVDGPLTRWFGPDASGTDAYRQTRDWLLAVDAQGYATAYAAFAAGDGLYADCWPGVGIPALFLTGTEDRNSTAAMAREMAGAAPRGRVALIKGHGHMAQMTAPDRVNAALQAWLAEEVPA